ncbi:MAG: ATP-binding cassette domain-containing protein, partial [Gemmatimonadetes bacterium]|nr:ATP-binding cassette domain-containing protein [Gemmatimonadota bacterium]
MVPASCLRQLDLHKHYGRTIALDGVSLDIGRGVTGLLGPNGAGKSTLVKIVSGLYHRDSGELRFDGSDVDFGSTAEAKAHGIAVIYQEPTLFPDLSVLENLFMGRQPLGSWRRIDRAAMRAEARHLFDRLGVRIDPDRPAQGLS